MATETKTVIWQIVGQTVGMGALTAQTNAATASMTKLALRAAAVIPLWVAMRAAIFALPRAISAATSEWLTFQTEMSRVGTVTRTTAEGFKILEQAIVDSASKSKVSFKDTASVVYALGSAGLTATQQLEGFNHVINLAVGTGGNLEQTAKLVAGAVNVFGKSLKDATTEGEKFKKVADIIAYTYSTQQVELAELSTAMGYVASVGTLVDISFEDLVATIGVLNTGMLKGSKSGTSLVNAFIQLARKSDRLGVLGIAVDTSKPLNFIEVMDGLYGAIQSDKLSLEQLSTVMSTFGIRGGRAVGLLLNNYEAFKRVLDETKTKSLDFAEVMRRIAEDNIPAQAKKIRDSFTGIWMGVLNEVEKPWMSFLKNIFDQLERFRAHETYKKLSGESTLGERLQKSVPAAGVGVGALILGRGITPSIGLNPRLENRAAQMAEVAPTRLNKLSQMGGTLNRHEQQILKTGQASASQFRGAAIREAGYMNSAMMNLGGTLKNVSKVALLAYGALKIFQGIMNQVAPDARETAQLNEAVGKIEHGIGTLMKLFVRFSEWIGSFVGSLWYQLVTALQEGFAPLKSAFTDLADIFKILMTPLITIIQYLKGEITGLQALKQMMSSGKSITDGVVDLTLKANNRSRLDRLVSSTGEKTQKGSLDTVFAPIMAIARALGTASAQPQEVNTEREIKDMDARRTVVFQSAIQGFEQRMKLAQERDPYEQINKQRKAIADEKIKNSQASYGLTNYEETMQNLYKEWIVKTKTDQEYTAGIISAQAAMEKLINTLGIKIGNEEYRKNLKDSLDVTGASALTPGSAAYIARQKSVMLQKPGMPDIEDVPEGTDAGAILRKFDADIKRVIADNRADTLGLFGISAEAIEMKKFQAEYNQFVELKKEQLDTSKEELDISDFMVENSEKLHRLVKTNAGIREDVVKLQEKGLKLTLDQNKALKEQGAYVKDAFKDTFKDIFETGDFDFSTAATKFGGALKTAWQDQFSDIFADVATNLTGLDGVFGGIMTAFGDTLKSPIAQAHLDGITAGAKIIINAHQVGMGTGAAGVTGGSSSTTGGIFGGLIKNLTGPTSFLGKMANTSIFKQKTGAVYQPAGTRPFTPYGDSTTDMNMTDIYGDIWNPGIASQMTGGRMGYGGGVSGRGQFNQVGTPSKDSMTYGQMAGVGIQSAMTGFSTYQAAGGAGGGGMAMAAGVMSGLGALGMGLGAMGVGATAGAVGLAAIPVVGWIGLGLAAGGMILGAMNQPEKPAFRNEEVREQTTQIASRIDITNNSLEWVNRNLVELKQELTYIMKESYYFSERSETERFAIDAQRGTQGF